MSRASIKNRVKEAATNDEPLGTEEFEPDPALSLEEHKALTELKALQQQYKETVDTHELRVEYTGKIFILVCCWLGFVIGFIVLSGFKVYDFKLSDSVLIAFITSTTINVVGLFIVVAKWMYPTALSKQRDSGITPDTTKKTTRKMPPVP